MVEVGGGDRPLREVAGESGGVHWAAQEAERQTLVVHTESVVQFARSESQLHGVHWKSGVHWDLEKK